MNGTTRCQPYNRRRKKNLHSSVSVAVAATLSLTACGTDAASGSGDGDEDLESHFTGETVNFLVGYGPGGGFDIMARIMREYLPEHLPGNPRVVVQNVEGAAGLRAAGQVVNSPADGLSIATFGAVYLNEAIGAVDEDVSVQDDVTIIGTVDDNNAFSEFFCLRRDVAETFDEAVAQASDDDPIQFAAQNVGLDRIFVDELDAPIEHVYGFGGSTESLQAVESGEVEGARCEFQQLTQTFPHWIDEDFVVPLFALYTHENVQAQKRGEDVPDAPDQEYFDRAGWDRPPLIDDLVQLDETQEAVLDVIRKARQAQSRYIAVSAETPDHIVQAWREALQSLAEDEEFIAEMEENNRRVLYTPGDEIEQIYREISETDPELLELMRSWIQ